MALRPTVNYRTPKRGSRVNPFRAIPPRQHIVRWKLAAALREHNQIIRAMRDPSFELYDEEFSMIHESLLRLRELGVEVDSCLMALVNVLCRQMINGDNDGDMDGPNTDRLVVDPEFY